MIATALDFVLPPELEAHAPPETRGGTRDAVRLMVSHRHDDTIRHLHFPDIVSALTPGDVLVINTSGTLNAALPVAADSMALELHLSTRLPGDLWVVELRTAMTAMGTQPSHQGHPGMLLALPGGGEAILHTPYDPQQRDCDHCAKRLWVATLRLPHAFAGNLVAYLDRYGAPIRYSYVPEPWPSSAYQTVYVTEMGSAEMPSAGRAFTAEILTRFVARGVQVVPLLLHTGVASLEDHEPPYEEWYRVPPVTARAINAAHGAGQHVIAVGTTVVRALETVCDDRGICHPGEGWTALVITPERGVRAVDGLLTGLHEPRASHLAMLAAFASHDLLTRAYNEALRERYLWHEFGDLHLLLP